MIPKIIHYCWFGGGEIPENNKKCMESWKKYCPDYEIRRWDETNYDVHCNQYISEAYKAKKWGFVSDFARLDIIYKYGGIYLDTDVELIQSLDPLLEHEGFMGFEDLGQIALGLGFGASSHHDLIKYIMDDGYGKRAFIKENGDFDLTPIPVIVTESMANLGVKPNGMKQIINGIVIYPMEYFCPRSQDTGIMNITENTYSIHWYDGSWLEKEQIALMSHRYKMVEKFGTKVGTALSMPYSHLLMFRLRIRTKGIKKTVRYYLKERRKGV